MSKFNLMIQIQGEHYFPAVKHKAEFAYVGQLAINAPKPVEDAHEQDETLADIMQVITQDNKELVQSYEQWLKTILSIVAAGELTYEQLLGLYITFLPEQSTCSLSLLSQELAARAPVIANVPMDKEQHTKELLASALASWISTGQVEADSLFDRLENQPSAALR